MVKSLRGVRGVTLIELMIVVSILGLLAAIAIPNYLRYQAKSRQGEAKLILAGIFEAEASYFAEWAMFGNIIQAGYGLNGASNRYTYRSGGASPGGGASTNTLYIDQIPAGTGIVYADGQGPGAIVAMTNTPGNPPGFTATAVANIDNDPCIDQWHVNDIKQNLLVADNNDVLC